MPKKMQDFQVPVKEQMVEFEKKFRFFMKSDVALLDRIMNYIVKSKGKQMRPILVFLTAGATGEIIDQTYRGAALIELLHTATLVHDDVVDDADYRRGFFSIKALWKNKTAVLVGDYLLSRGLLLSVENNDFELLKYVSTAVREMSEGELMQIEKARRLDITEEVYFEIIRQKTATLIAACTAVGAASAGASEDVVKRMHKMGEKIGIAFQIKDDLFDYGTAEIGKPLGIDIKEKKMTLPLIYALNNAKWLKRKEIIFKIKTQNTNQKVVREIIEFVKNSGGLEYATETMEKYIKEGREILDELPDSEYKTALHQLISYVVDREI
ncbi:polyprenyl synthetase family protein [Flammeovirga kamogawensis]|uniref:Polyprenyl synthetase family protein n=1 Tax=Flammeovirga kamogawensis TaxID=373891 RepID=A0ABX8GY74_9BACT|nr:polyprenyl synthetase family protein [Flammeovirga kamogawensis]QWG08358.1 polyprenyl synthetase family protein [Flammeovirga kamogawensis]TRX66655.1 polyprenyl synthetase family protein [Flammeovirga kamogawensis]